MRANCVKLNVTGRRKKGTGTFLGYDTFGQVAFSSINVETPVPEPSALILLGCGLIGVRVFRRILKKSWLNLIIIKTIKGRVGILGPAFFVIWGLQ